MSVSKVLNVIAACSENRVIGRGGKLPWRIPEDAEHFRRLTAGKICIVGRVSYDSWAEATQGDRQPIVLTSRPLAGSCAVGSNSEPIRRHRAGGPGRCVPFVARSLADAIAVAERLPGDLFVCGGQRIFEETLALDRPLRLHLTLVHAEVEGDRRFPDWRLRNWREIERRTSADPNFRYTFHTLETVDPLRTGDSAP